MNLAAVVNKFGAPLEIQETPIPSPGKDEVVIKMKIFPVNPADIASINGQYPGWKPSYLPAVPGLEGVGTVHAIGEGVENVKRGDRVVPVLADNPRSYQQYVLVKKGFLVKVPERLDDEVASQLLVNPATAWGMLERLNLQRGQYVLQSAAGCEVGRMVISAAKHRGLKTINLVRRQEQVEELKKIGGDIVLCTSMEDLSERIKRETGGGAHGALDCVLGDLTGKMMSALVPGGKVIIYGAFAGPSYTAMGADLLFRNIRVEGFWAGPWLNAMFGSNDPKKDQMLKEIFSWFERDPHCGAHIGERFALKDINKAIEAAQKRGKPGKVLVYCESARGREE